jgi:hypothetical protein
MAKDTIVDGGARTRPSLASVIVAATIGNVLEWFDFVVYVYFAVTISEVFFPTGKPDGVALNYLRRVRPGLFRAAAGRGDHRQLYRQARPQGRPDIVDRADDDRHDADGSHARLCDDRPYGATSDHVRSPITGIFGRRRVRQRGRVPRRARLASPGLRRELAMGLDRDHLDHRLAIRYRVDDTADARPAGQLGLAASISSACSSARPGFISVRAYRKRPSSSRPKSRRRCRSANCCAAIRCQFCWRSAPRSSPTARITSSPTFRLTGVKTLLLPAYTGFVATLVGGIILAIFSVVAGYWSDRMPRPRIMLIAGWLFLLTAYPAFYLMAAWPTLAACVIAVGWLNLVKAGYSGVLPSLLAEQFPVQTRAIGVSLSFSTAVSIFGGLRLSSRPG